MKFRTQIVFGLLAIAGSACAQVVLTDGNSSVEIDPTSTNPTFLRGMTSWEVDGTQQLFNQWYWYRIGDSAEKTIDSISNGIVSLIGNNSAQITYQNQDLRFEILFTLVGGSIGSGASDVSEVVRVTNLTSSALDFHLFEYDDFDVSGTFTDDTAIALNSSTIRQSDATGSVTVGAVQIPDRWQIAEVPTIFSMLDDGVASNLDNSGSGTGPSDVAFAMQWDRSLAAGGTFLMSKNKIIESVPEPLSLTVLVAGTLCLARRRKTPK